MVIQAIRQLQFTWYYLYDKLRNIVCVQKDISVGNRSYDGVGNVGLLMQESYCPVHVRRAMVEKANGGDDKELRDYKNA